MPDSLRYTDPLSQDIHLLGDALGRVIRRQAGIELFEQEERIRALTKVRRRDDDLAIDEHIQQLVRQWEPQQAELVARTFTLYFELINIAEEQHRIRVLRRREREAHPRPLRESIRAAVASLQQMGSGCTWSRSLPPIPPRRSGAPFFPS